MEGKVLGSGERAGWSEETGIAIGVNYQGGGCSCRVLTGKNGNSASFRIDENQVVWPCGCA